MRRYTATLALGLLGLVLLAAAPSAQGTLSGTITDAASGETLVGVNVLVIGTTRGAATDLDGQFQIADLCHLAQQGSQRAAVVALDTEGLGDLALPYRAAAVFHEFENGVTRGKIVHLSLAKDWRGALTARPLPPICRPASVLRRSIWPGTA